MRINSAHATRSWYGATSFRDSAPLLPDRYSICWVLFYGLIPIDREEAEISPQYCGCGVVGTVGGLGDGQGPFGQRPGLGQLPQVLQDGGEVAQAGGDGGVVGAVGGLGDGQGPFGQRPGLGQLPQVLQMVARLFRRVPMAGWSGP